ncbi:DUF559 domain-containing protein [Rhodococcus aetherivorans]|uniref:DUF559 domain-containing protein n=1 Tax=Rhodococcus aetherivorans TaxID=191292 RepID=A0AA46NU70_9NOCA|nr:DUF559 domain-containing protein [Rhodococcus aetherivorans]UYF93119.1 DUF559 domain-containing protein [Rhodococcus aetherivorans]
MGEFDEPFLGTQAVRAGLLTPHQLRRFRRVHRDVYIHRDAAVTPYGRARAAWLWAGGDGVLAGYSAAALFGSRWIDATAPAELIRRGSRRGTDGVVVHAETILDDEVCTLADMRVTSPARTAFDLGRRLVLDTAVEQLDALCRATRLDPAHVAELSDRHSGARGVRRLRQALPLVDPGAESLPETRVRLLLVRGGLPRPSTQVPVAGVDGRVLGWADLGWKQWRTLVEYDGIHHWTDERQRTKDIERYEAFAALGWSVVRVNSEQLRLRPGSVVERVRMRLRAAGASVRPPSAHNSR